MPPRKRTHGDVQEPVAQAQPQRSVPRTSDSRKRMRVSLDPQTAETTPAPDDDSSSDDDSSDDEMSDPPQSPPKTQYEIMRDNGFKHLEDTDRDDLLATQALARRTNQLGDNAVAEGGIIESVTCINFMCHEKLHVELGPLINFIVGENGSGKSAVLTALTLCLGGKASDTNRGGSLKSFVKQGCEKGQLIVRIKNGGTDAYQPDVYGDCIIVERHFSSAGASGFKIKSANDRTISTKKQEVDEISEWYALQIGNPLTVLSQDNARQFLNSASPTQKYRYFVSGVQLEQLDNDYKMSQDTLERTELVRLDLNERIEIVKKEMESAVRLSETALKNQSLREKSRLYRHQLAWSQVEEQERVLKKRKSELEEREKQIEEHQETCQSMTEGLDTLDDKLGQLQQAREALDEERDGIDEKIVAAEAVFGESKKELTDLNREERDAHGRLKIANDEVKALEKEIEKEQRRLAESTGQERADKDAELTAATSKEHELAEEQRNSSEQRPVLEERNHKAQEEWEKCRQRKDQKRKEIVTAEKQAKELEKSTGSPMDGYDRDMQQLAKAVSEDGSFEHKPVGPLGAYIRLLKPEWSGILEKTFGEGLNAFVVRSKQDQNRLAGLMRRFKMSKQPPIYIAYGGSFDTSAQEPDARYDTILRVLEFDDELVKTQMIINNQIEKIILIQDRVDAERVMIDAERPPRNVTACMCFHDGRGKRGFGLRITNRGGTTSTSPVPPSNQRPRMRTDAGNHLAVLKEQTKQLVRELRDLNQEESNASRIRKECEEEILRNRKRVKDLDVAIRKVQADIQQVQIDLDAFEGVDDRLNQLREDLESKKDERENLGNQYGAMGLTKKDLIEKVDAAKEKLQEEKSVRDDYQSKVVKAERKLNSQKDMRRIALVKKNEAYAALDITREERRRAEVKQHEQEEQVADFITQARNVAPERVHIPEDDTYQSIEAKYKKLREQLLQRERRLGATDKEIHDRAADAKKRYEDVTKQTRDVDDTIKSLKLAIGNRLELWRQFQRQISARVRIQFSYLLSERGFRGKIEFNHKDKKVIIHVEPDETKKSAAGRSTKTLSGGEKSFSSICMLLSVWEAIGSPIRCLDEFDVFMDNVNRAISTNMLVDVARRSVSRQYILITPNAIEGRARLDKDVKIIRLTDPRQRTIDSMMN